MGDSQQTYQLKIGNSFIGRRHETKLLGFKITDNLSWGKHCDDVLEKVSKNTNLLLLCRPYPQTLRFLEWQLCAPAYLEL